MNDQWLRQRQKIAAFHTLWELGQARAALRRMGETLEDPPARSREAFADAIYNLTGLGQGEPGQTGAHSHAAPSIPPALHNLTGEGQGDPGLAADNGSSHPVRLAHTTGSPHLQVLPGGEETPLGSCPAGAGETGTRPGPRHGDRPSRAVSKRQPGTHPTHNFDSQETS